MNLPQSMNQTPCRKRPRASQASRPGRRLMILTALAGSLGLTMLLGAAVIPARATVHSGVALASDPPMPQTQGGPWVP